MKTNSPPSAVRERRSLSSSVVAGRCEFAPTGETSSVSLVITVTGTSGLSARHLGHLADQLQRRHCDERLDAVSTGAVKRHRNRGQGLAAAADRIDGFDDEIDESEGGHRSRLSAGRSIRAATISRPLLDAVDQRVGARAIARRLVFTKRAGRKD
jgi:hypothetical protein